MGKYCPECGTELNSESKFCPECSNNLLQKPDEKKSSIKESFSKEVTRTKPIHIIGIIVAFAIFLIVIISISNGSLFNILIPSEKPDVDVQSCNIDTGWDITKGYYATFTTRVKNVGDSWAVGCVAQVTVSDQNGETEYTGVISIGRQTSQGFYSPLYENEEDLFTCTADYEMGDSYLKINMLITWSNTDGDRFSEQYSRTFFL